MGPRGLRVNRYCQQWGATEGSGAGGSTISAVRTGWGRSMNRMVGAPQHFLLGFAPSPLRTQKRCQRGKSGLASSVQMWKQVAG